MLPVVIWGECTDEKKISFQFFYTLIHMPRKKDYTATHKDINEACTELWERLRTEVKTMQTA